MIVLSRENYYMLYAYFKIASDAQDIVREHTKLINDILKDGREADSINDAVYDPAVNSLKKDYDKLLSELGITIEWKPAENKFAKQQKEEKE